MENKQQLLAVDQLRVGLKFGSTTRLGIISNLTYDNNINYMTINLFTRSYRHYLIRVQAFKFRYRNVELHHHFLRSKKQTSTYVHDSY